MTQLDESTAARLATLFHTLSDPTRVRIISLLLDSELSVSTLAERLGMSISAVSHQLSGLRYMRLVQVRRVGRQAYYCLDDEHVADLLRQGLKHISHD